MDAGDVRRVLDEVEKLPSGLFSKRPAEPTEPRHVDTSSRSARPCTEVETGKVPLIFVHSAPRTSSTWFWDKSRRRPSALCYYEPFNEVAAWISPAEASVVSGAS